MPVKQQFTPVFFAYLSCIGYSVLTPGTSQAGTTDTDLWRDFNRSAFSTTSILSDLTNNKQLSRPEVISSSEGCAIVSSQPGAFQYDSQTRQSTAAQKVAEAIRDTQKMEDRQNAEITQHPFWYAPFWTHSPLAIAGFLLGGDHHSLEIPPTEFEKLGAASYGNEAEVRKFERSVSFGNQGNK
jgi:hypothetical protein